VVYLSMDLRPLRVGDYQTARTRDTDAFGALFGTLRDPIRGAGRGAASIRTHGKGPTGNGVKKTKATLGTVKGRARHDD
jgi:hypothetical protein